MKTQIKKIFSCLSVLLVVVVLLLGTSLPVNAQNGYSEAPDPQTIIAELYAKRYGVTIDEAIHRLNLQNAFPGLSTALEDNEKDTYGGLWIQHEPEYKIVIAFTRNGEKTLAKYSQYISKDVAPYIEVRTVKKSQAELINELEKLLTSLQEQGLKADCQVDIINNCVSINIAKADENVFNDLKNSGKLAIPDGLTISNVDSLFIPSTDIYGGLTIQRPLGTPYCTIGFSVRHINGTKGIATVAHALNDNIYYNTTLLPFQQEAWGGYYDCQWHTCPGLTVINKIQYWSSGATMNITSTKSQSEQHVGDIVSKYGITTLYTAGQITSTTNAPSYIPGAKPTWIVVHNVFGYTKLADGGDSGGPWFTANIAWGIESGYSSNWQDAVYMAVNYLGGLRIYVMTTP